MYPMFSKLNCILVSFFNTTSFSFLFYLATTIPLLISLIKGRKEVREKYVTPNGKEKERKKGRYVIGNLIIT